MHELPLGKQGLKVWGPVGSSECVFGTPGPEGGGTHPVIGQDTASARRPGSMALVDVLRITKANYWSCTTRVHRGFWQKARRERVQVSVEHSRSDLKSLTTSSVELLLVLGCLSSVAGVPSWEVLAAGERLEDTSGEEREPSEPKIRVHHSSGTPQRGCRVVTVGRSEKVSQSGPLAFTPKKKH